MDGHPVRAPAACLVAQDDSTGHQRAFGGRGLERPPQFHGKTLRDVKKSWVGGREKREVKCWVVSGVVRVKGPRTGPRRGGDQGRVESRTGGLLKFVFARVGLDHSGSGRGWFWPKLVRPKVVWPKLALVDSPPTANKPVVTSIFAEGDRKAGRRVHIEMVLLCCQVRGQSGSL